MSAERICLFRDQAAQSVCGKPAVDEVTVELKDQPERDLIIRSSQRRQSIPICATHRLWLTDSSEDYGT